MSRSIALLTTLIALLFICSCAANPASDKPKAVTTEAAPVSPSSPAGQGEKYSITSDNSKIEFVGSKVTGSHHGAFEKFSGAISYIGETEKSVVTIAIDMNSETTDTPEVTRHLKTADFFDIAKYPQATFTSTEIKAGGEKGATHTVTGNLSLHGVTKSITFPATIAVSPGVITVESSFAINRKDFGVNFPGAPDNLIRNEVLLTLHIRAVK